MKDLPRVFSDYCKSKTPNILYCYGDIYHLNLFLNVPDNQKTPDNPKPLYFLQEPVVRKKIVSPMGTNSGTTFTGAFSLLYESHRDEPYFNERSPDRSDANSRYTKYIEPLTSIADEILDEIACLDGVTVDFYDVVDTINFMSQNRDGVLVMFKITLDRWT